MSVKNKKYQNMLDLAENTSSLLNASTPFSISEAYRAARTNIGFVLPEEGCKCIALSSPSPSEGKTTNCLNLAITFGMTGAKVLIVDVDLRRPRIHKLLSLKQKPGVTNILGGFCQIKEGIKNTLYKNVDAITSGDIPPNPAELLASNRMEQLISVLKEYYDYIFFDCPPINVVTDATVMSKYMNGVILVVRQGVTTLDTTSRAVESLTFAGAKILGFLFNDVGKNANSYRYKYKYRDKYGYSYKSGYGYGYYTDNVKDTTKSQEAVGEES